MSKRIPIIIQWMEENPRLTRDARKKMNALEKATKQLQTAMVKSLPAGKEQEKVMAAINSAALEQKISIAGKAQPALKLLNQSLRNLDKVGRKQVPMMKKISRGLEKWGWRLGWLGFRMVIVGRMLVRYMMDPLQKAVGLLKNWEKSLEEVAISLGLLEASGMGTADLFGFLEDTLTELPEAGMEFQAALGSLMGVLIGIATKILPIFSKGLVQLADAIVKAWKVIEPKFIPALEKLMKKVMPRLIILIDKFLPLFAEGFIEGMGTAIPLVLDVMAALVPFADSIGTIIGFLLPLAPLLMMFGYALYFIAPALILLKGASWVLHTAFAALKWLAPKLATEIFGCEIALGSLKTASSTASSSMWTSLIGPVGFFTAAIVALVLYKDEIKLAQEATAEFFYGSKEAAEAAGEAFQDALWDMEQATHILENIGWADEWNKALNSTDRAIAATGEWLIGLGEALWGLCFKHATPEALAFVDALNRVQSEIRPTMGALGGLGGALEGTMGGGVGEAGTSYMTVSVEVNIANVSGVADLDNVTDAVSRGIAEGLRRRRR